MKYIKNIFILLFTSFSTIGFSQQDPAYSLYMFNPFGINPAYAGSREMLSTVLVHRSQWAGLDGAPTTQAFSAHMPSTSQKMGYGVHFINDQIGPKQIISAGAAYAYKLKLGQGKLSMALRAGIHSYKIHWDRIDYKHTNDVIQNTARSQFMVPSFDFGTYYYTNTFHAGISVDHLNHSQFNLTDATTSGLSTEAKLATHFTATVGNAFIIDRETILKTTLLVRGDESANMFIDLTGSILLNQSVWFGISLSSRKSVTAMIEYNLTPKIRAGYAYDFSVTPITTGTFGTHELFIGYDIRIFNYKLESPRYF